MFQLNELFSLIFSATAIADALPPSSGNPSPPISTTPGMRVWQGHEEVMRKLAESGFRFIAGY